MESVQMLQQFAPATVMVALLALPWVTLVALHALSIASRDRRDDNWGDLALAATRWAGAVIEPVRRRAIDARQVVMARRSARVARGQQLLPHAA